MTQIKSSINHSGAISVIFNKLDKGEIAELRRASSNAHANFGSQLFWAILHELNEAERVSEDLASITKWSALFRYWALLHKRHSPEGYLGKALAEAGISEARFLRLLRCPEEHRITELDRAIQIIAANPSIKVNMADIEAYLFLHNREKFFIKIAKDFFALQKN